MAIDYFSQLGPKAKELYLKIKKDKNDIDPEKFVCIKTDGTIFNFNKFKISLNFTEFTQRCRKWTKRNKNIINQTKKV